MRNNLKKDRRGNFFRDNFSALLVTVLCLGVLVYFLGAVYFSIGKSEKIKEANEILNGPKDGIVAIVKAGNLPFNKEIFNPVGWSLFGFTEKKPNSCLDENCLCICERAGSVATFFDKNAQIKTCDKNGVCSVMSNLKKGDFEIKIEKGKSISLSIKSTEGGVEIT
jgi:hypothetical protein